MLGSGAFCQQLCDLLLGGIRSYIQEEYFQVLNRIKSEKLDVPNPQAFAEMIRQGVKSVIQQHENILNAEVQTANGNMPLVLQSLNFKAKADHIIEEKCNEFEATYSEYLKQKLNEQARLAIAKKSLEKAEEANRISRRNFWITGLSSLSALVVSVVSAYISYTKNSL